MRRSALAVVAFLLILPASAAAFTDTASYGARMALSATPSAAAPANVALQWRQHLDTSPSGSQPDTAAASAVYIPTGMASNAAFWPACGQSQIDGQPSFPAACSDAVVGSGTATAYAGSPGSPLSNSVQENLYVTVVNAGANELLLVINSAPAAPVLISNRVIPGALLTTSPPFAFGWRFDVPPDLQNQLGLAIVLTDLEVLLPQTTRTIDSGSGPRSASFLQATQCDTSATFGATTMFVSGGYPTNATTLGASFTIPCALGSGLAGDVPLTAQGAVGGLVNYPPTDNGNGGGNNNGNGQTPTAPTSTPPAGSNPAPTPPAPPRITGGAHIAHINVASNGTFGLPGVQVACPSAAANGCDVAGDAVTGVSLARARKPTPIAKVRFHLAAGKSSAVRFRLTKKAAKALRRKHRLPATIKLRVSERGQKTVAKTYKTLLVSRAKKH